MTVTCELGTNIINCPDMYLAYYRRKVKYQYLADESKQRLLNDDNLKEHLEDIYNECIYGITYCAYSKLISGRYVLGLVNYAESLLGVLVDLEYDNITIDNSTFNTLYSLNNLLFQIRQLNNSLLLHSVKKYMKAERKQIHNIKDKIKYFFIGMLDESQLESLTQKHLNDLIHTLTTKYDSPLDVRIHTDVDSKWISDLVQDDLFSYVLSVAVTDPELATPYLEDYLHVTAYTISTIDIYSEYVEDETSDVLSAFADHQFIYSVAQSLMNNKMNIADAKSYIRNFFMKSPTHRIKLVTAMLHDAKGEN